MRTHIEQYAASSGTCAGNQWQQMLLTAGPRQLTKSLRQHLHIVVSVTEAYNTLLTNLSCYELNYLHIVVSVYVLYVLCMCPHTAVYVSSDGGAW